MKMYFILIHNTRLGKSCEKFRRAHTQNTLELFMMDSSFTVEYYTKLYIQSQIAAFDLTKF